MMRIYKEKNCAHCNNQYTPVGSKNNFCSLFCKVKSLVEAYRKGDQDCWEANDPYERIRYLGITYKLHRESFRAYRGEFDSKLHMCHKCDNPKCMNPEHLFPGTQLDNSRDMVSKNRQAKGEVLAVTKRGDLNGFYGKTHSDELKIKWSKSREGTNNQNAKLTKREIFHLKRLRYSGKGTKELAILFGIHTSTVSRHVKGWTKSA